MAKSIAPSLYAKTRRKKITVHQALKNEKWIDHIYPPTMHEEVTEFVKLKEALRGFTLNESVEDTIIWRWTQMVSTLQRVLIRFSSLESSVR